MTAQFSGCDQPSSLDRNYNGPSTHCVSMGVPQHTPAHIIRSVRRARRRR